MVRFVQESHGGTTKIAEYGYVLTPGRYSVPSYSTTSSTVTALAMSSPFVNVSSSRDDYTAIW